MVHCGTFRGRPAGRAYRCSMSTPTPQSLAQRDLQAAKQMRAEAVRVDALIKSVDALVKSLLQGGAWRGDDATEFGLRWERELQRLVKIRADLLASAVGLQDEARRRHAEAALRPRHA